MENPCVKCTMSLLAKATCCGCPERLKWEKEQKKQKKANCSECIRAYDYTCSGALAEKCFGKW